MVPLVHRLVLARIGNTVQPLNVSTVPASSHAMYVPRRRVAVGAVSRALVLVAHSSVRMIALVRVSGLGVELNVLQRQPRLLQLRR